MRSTSAGPISTIALNHRGEILCCDKATFGGPISKVYSETRAKKNVIHAIEHVSSRLGNTPTFCRKCYVHPDILTAYLGGEVLLKIESDIDQALAADLGKLRPEEAAALAFLRTRVAYTLRRKAPRDHLERRRCSFE